MDRLTIRTAIRNITLLEATNVSNNDVNTYINQGYHELSVAFPWPWLETTADFTVGAGTRSYALPTNFDYAITMIDTGIDKAITHIAAKDFFEMVGQDSSSTSASARMWTIYDNQVYFSLPPSTAITAAYTLYYYKNITTLDADDDIPAFHDGFHWMLVDYVKWKLYDREEMFEQSERSRIIWEQYLGEMMHWYGSPVKKAPFLWGDGRPVRTFNNLAILDL
jgi:hypothetical protein